jgi:hypothetical protein
LEAEAMTDAEILALFDADRIYTVNGWSGSGHFLVHANYSGGTMPLPPKKLVEEVISDSSAPGIPVREVARSPFISPGPKEHKVVECEKCYGTGECECSNCEHMHDCGFCEGEGEIEDDVRTPGNKGYAIFSDDSGKRYKIEERCARFLDGRAISAVGRMLVGRDESGTVVAIVCTYENVTEKGDIIE